MEEIKGAEPTTGEELTNPLTKEEKNEIESIELLNRVVSGNIENIKDRVAFILNNLTEARNSDVELAWAYWKSFESEKFNGSYITKEELRNLTKITSLTRIRAKIQNEYKLFQADEVVQQFRGVLEEDHKREAIEDKPSGLGLYSVYIDETGKTQDYLSVGSLWILKSGAETAFSAINLASWKKENNIDYEFHFKEINRGRIESFKQFFTKFISQHPEAGFKLIVINNKGFSNLNVAITDLTFHLLNKGIIHENETGRARLPRVLQVWVDEDEKGSDELKLQNIRERITSQKIDGLFLDEFRAVSSKNNFFIQAIDLFAGAVNRKLHNPGGGNVKDEFADFVLQTLNFDVNLIDKDNQDMDRSKLFNLR